MRLIISIVAPGQGKKKDKKKRSAIIANVNLLVEDNGLIRPLKVEYFQRHIPHLVFVIILEQS